MRAERPGPVQMELFVSDKILPPVYFLSAIILAVLLHFLLPMWKLVHYPWLLFGLIPFSTGIVFNLLADQTFKKYDTTVKPFERSEVLVTSGVFRVSRNPMYLGMQLILVGIAVMLGSLAPFVIVVVMAVIFDRKFIVPEERMLADRFGLEFRQYCRRVRKWI